MMKFVRSLEDPVRMSRIFDNFSQVIGSGNYSEGAFCQQADKALTKMFQRPTVVLNSCGSALFAMFKFYRKLGHRYVVVQNNTFYATGAMALQAGLIPILCDNCLDDPSMSLESLDQILKLRVDARLVCLTHVGGWIAKDYHPIAELCKQKGVTLVEDCAHAIGLKVAGTLGAAACWSFYPTKALPVGEGGALSTVNEELFQFVEKFRSYGKFKKSSGEIAYEEGMNLRMSEWDAAVLCVQLDYLPRILAARRADAQKLQSIAPCLLQGESNYYKYPVEGWRATGLQTVGAIYRRSDQLDRCLKVLKVVPLSNSHQWAIMHACLPIGENLYEGLSLDSIREMLAKESHEHSTVRSFRS